MDRSEFVEEVIFKCLDEMYRRSQPSITLEELKEGSKNGKYDDKNPFYKQHYLSEEDYKEIIEDYIYVYNLHDPFKEYCDTVYQYLKEGGLKDKYIPAEIDENGMRHPGYRDYEKTPKLSDIMPEEYAQKCLDLIEECKNFYKLNRDETKFRFNVANYGPNSNKEAVREYWKSKNVDIKFKKRVYNDDIDEYEYVDDD